MTVELLEGCYKSNMLSEKELIRREKIRRAKTGKKRPDMAGVNNYFYGKQLTGEKNGFYGKSHPEETRKKMSEAKPHRYIDGIGYIRILKPDHPFHDNRGYVKEHRLVMEEYLGRYLTKDEIVHHINENPSDNRPENLQIMTRPEHVKHHTHWRYEADPRWEKEL